MIVWKTGYFCSLHSLQNLNFPKGVWQHYVGEVGKSVIIVLQIILVYCVTNFIELSQSL